MTLEQFLIACPEFEDTDKQLIRATLNEAALELDTVQWGPLYDTGHKYLTAHKLAISPMGQNARLLNTDGTSTYEKHFKALVMKLPLGLGVT